MNYNPSIFKAYDIRGVYGVDFDDYFAYQLGIAYAKLRKTELGRHDVTVIVSRDMRLSSEALHSQVIQALCDSGITVIDIGLASTPTFYFAVAHYGYDGGIQISASHNPKEYNGFKLVRQLALPMGLGSGLSDIQNLIEEDRAPSAIFKGKVISKTNILEDQVRYDLSFVDIDDIKPFRLVIDTANAMGAPYFDELLKQLPQLTVEKMNWPLDGTFPAHEADPYKPENVAELGRVVKEKEYDFGIATDGDSDRIFFVDNEGIPVEPGITRAILAKLFLQEKPHTTIAYDIRPGKITYDTIIAEGGQPLVTQVGHSLIKAAMIDTGAYFGGESSGHFFLNMDKQGCYEVPGIVLLKLLVELSKTGQKLSDYVKPYQKYFHSGEISFKVTNPQDLLALLKEKYHDGKQNNLDGLTIEYPDFWFNVRLSNTEPLLRLNIEAVDKETMEQRRDELLALLRQ